MSEIKPLTKSEKAQVQKSLKHVSASIRDTVLRLLMVIESLELENKRLGFELFEVDEEAVDKAAQDLAIQEQCYRMWDNVEEESKEELRETIRFCLNAYRFNKYGKRMPLAREMKKRSKSR